MEVKRNDVPHVATEYQIINKSGQTRTKRTGTVVREIAVACFDTAYGRARGNA